MFTDGEIAALNSLDHNRRQTRKVLDRKDDLLGKLSKRIDELEDALRLQIMHSEGLRAQVRALKDEHPNSPLLKHTGKHLLDGRPETVLSTHYYKGFDAKGRELGITSPERLRDRSK